LRKSVNQFIAVIEIAIHRVRSSIGIHLAISLGILTATTTICALMLYAEAVNVSLLWDYLAQAHEGAVYDLLIKGERNIIDKEIYRTMDNQILDQMSRKVGLPLTRVGRHGWSKSLTIIPPGISPTGQRSQLPRTRFQFYADIEDQVEIITGVFPKTVSDPQDIVEVMITEKLSNELGLQVGDEFIVEDFTGSSRPMQVTARLTAVIRLKDAEDSFWFYAPWFLDEALTVPEESFFQAITLTFVPAETEVTWAANFDERRINIDNVNRVIAGLDIVKFELSKDLEGLTFLTKMDNTLQEFRGNTFMLKVLLIVLGAPVIGISLYYITMSSHLTVEHQRGEIAILKSRGTSTEQILGNFGVQGLIPVGISIGISPILAIPIAQLIGKATTFLKFSNTVPLPVQLRPVIFGYAAIAASLGLLAVWYPAINASRETIVTYRRTQARETRSSVIHKYYLDVVLLLIGCWSYYRLTKGGAIITRTETGGLSFDPLLLVTPLILTFSLSYITLRVLPFFMRGLATLISFTELNAPLLAVRQIARAPSHNNSLILILTFTLSLGLFTAVIANVFDRNYSDQAMYAAGTDLRTHEFDYETASWKVRPIEEYKVIPGVIEASPVIRTRLVGRNADIRAVGTLLAVSLDDFEQTSWWREDFQPDLGSMMYQLAQHENGIIADPQFIRKHRLKIGETFDIDVLGNRVDFILVGQTEFFPTLYPQGEDQFGVRGDRLVTRLDYLQNLLGMGPTEVWLKTETSQHHKIIATLNSTAKESLVVNHDGHELTGVRKEDPLRTGLFGALSFGFIAATVLSILGYLLYAYISIKSRALQFGVLRATGLSVQQLISALATEQLILISIGILLGTGLGGGAGWMFTQFLQLSVIAREAIPPFLVETPWSSITRLYTILIVIFIVALAVSIQLIRRMKVHAILRLGEQ
jgi:putative ABC transport system permease protein